MRFDADGPWDLEVEGFKVMHMTIGAYLVDIVADGPEGVTSTIRLEGRFEFDDPDGATMVLDPQGSWEPLAALLVLRHDVIRLARITNTSDLRVEFHSGHVVTSAADARYESWEVHVPGGVMVVAAPGGGEPAIWSGETPPRRFKVVDGKPVEITDS